MKDVIINQLAEVKKKFEAVKKATSEPRKSLYENLTSLTKIAEKYEGAWVGEWFNDNYNFYRRDFNKNISSRVLITEVEIKKDILNCIGIDLDEVRKMIVPISKQFFSLSDLIIAEFSYLKGTVNFENESELLTKIETFQWGMKPGEYIRSHRPNYAVVSDLSILNNGIQVPPHIQVGEDIVFILSMISSYDNFEKLVYQLIRMLEIKYSSSESEVTRQSPLQILENIFNKFHLVVTQLKNRYDQRPTIDISDEYDVQDVVNALLRINFEDIRKEEWTPSYAGSATRVDFLLKREQIIIELKKTRIGLKDKDIGNQLILDIAHYKSHPDCKSLICFVYDPANLVSNPRGLEDDLNRNSNNDMLVGVYIRP